VIRHRAGAEAPENFSLRIGNHRIGQPVLPCPGCRLFVAFLDADGESLQPFSLEPLPDFLFDDRSLLSATPSKGFPEDKKYREPCQIGQAKITVDPKIGGLFSNLDDIRLIIKDLHIVLLLLTYYRLKAFFGQTLMQFPHFVQSPTTTLPKFLYSPAWMSMGQFFRQILQLMQFAPSMLMGFRFRPNQPHIVPMGQKTHQILAL